MLMTKETRHCPYNNEVSGLLLIWSSCLVNSNWWKNKCCYPYSFKLPQDLEVMTLEQVYSLLMTSVCWCLPSSTICWCWWTICCQKPTENDSHAFKRYIVKFVKNLHLPWYLLASVLSVAKLRWCYVGMPPSCRPIWNFDLPLLS